jgi:hypothetical protein
LDGYGELSSNVEDFQVGERVGWNGRAGERENVRWKSRLGSGECDGVRRLDWPTCQVRTKVWDLMEVARDSYKATGQARGRGVVY